MSDHVCVNCSHGPHSNRKCGTCDCNNWQNSAVVTARALISLNNIIANILHYGFPEIEQKILDGKKAEIAEAQAQYEREHLVATYENEQKSNLVKLGDLKEEPDETT